MKIQLVIVAGGSGKRMGSEIPKQFLLLKNRPILMHTIERFYNYDNDIKILIVLPKDQFYYWNSLCKKYNFKINHILVEGGHERYFSVKNAIQKTEHEGIIIIHDGVRPLVNNKTIKNCIDGAIKYKACIPTLEPADSIRILTEKGNKPLLRSNLRIIQTPQCFNAELIKNAYDKIEYTDEITDDASVIEKYGQNIHLTFGNHENIKITNSVDLQLAEILL